MLATEAGQGREVALLHNNYAIVLWPVEGPGAALEVLQAGIAFARARGLTEMTEGLTGSTLDALVETGEHEQALTLATELATDLEASGSLFDLVIARTVQSRILTLRGQASRVADTLDWLEATIRETGQLDMLVVGLGTAAIARAALAQPDHATTLLDEIDATPGSRDTSTTRRCCLRWCAPPSPPTTPSSPTSSSPASNPTPPTTNTPSPPSPPPSPKPTATTRQPPTATPTPRNAGRPSASSPNRHSPTSATAAASSPSAAPRDATPVLLKARDIFTRLQAAPALAETDLLLQQATALSS